MKICNNCSSQWPDEAVICGVCGNKLSDPVGTAFDEDKTVAVSYANNAQNVQPEEPAQEVSQPQVDESTQQYSYEPVGENSVVDTNEETVAYNQTETPVENAGVAEPSYIPQDNNVAEPSYIPQGDEAVAPKKKPLKAIIIALIALLVVAGIVVAGFFTNWFGLGSPINGLLKASRNMANVENASFVATISADSEGETISEKVDGKIVIDKDKEDITYLMTHGKDKACMFDETIYQITDGYGSMNSVDVDEFFKAIEEAKEQEEVDWDEFVEEYELEEVIDDPDKIQPFIEDLYENCLTDSDWLEEYMGFEKSGDDYIFQPNINNLLDEVVSLCKDSDVFTKDAMEEFEEVVDEAKEGLKEVDLKIKLTISVDSGYISSVKAEVTGKNVETKDAIKATVALDITKINETKISKSELNAIKEETEKLVDEQTCDDCGYEFYAGEDKALHGDCDECGDHFDYLNDYSGEYLCDDCYEDQFSFKSGTPGTSAGYCWECNEYASTRYEYMCLDCYLEN